MVVTGGKMSKSLGNLVLVPNPPDGADPDDRFRPCSPERYRSDWE
jgi:cysteinyl-tRNA synthetase